jgi:hypothetical protein
MTKRKPRAGYFSPRSELQSLRKEMISAKKAEWRQCFFTVRKKQCKLLRSEKQKAFHLYKEEVSRQPQVRHFCRLMDRLRPQKPWRVNVVDDREDEV